MEINDDLAHDDFEVVNAVTSSVRANRLQHHREYVIDNWRKKEILNMKKVISNLTVKRDNLKKKRKKLMEYCKVYDKDFENLLKVDVPMSQAALSIKYKVLSKAKALDKIKKECDEHLKRHTESWNKAKVQWEGVSEVKKINELVKKLESLREYKNKILNEHNNKREQNQLSRKRFEHAVIKFAEGMSTLNKTQQMITENSQLQIKIIEQEKKVKTLREQIDRQIEFRVEKEMEKKNFQNFFGLDFDDFDTSINAVAAGNISFQDTSINENEFDPDCTNLSLDMSADQHLSLTIGTDRNLGTPIAMSTPLCAESINQQAENQTTPTTLTPSPTNTENPKNHNILTENNLAAENTKPAGSQQPLSQKITALNNKLSQQSYTINPQVQTQQVEEENGVQSPTSVISDDIGVNEQLTHTQYKNPEITSFDNNNTDKDVDYKEKYARSPDDQSILCEEPNSPPVRLSMPNFNSYKPPQATPNLMSFFDFGSNKQQKTDAASILDMF